MPAKKKRKPKYTSGVLCRDKGFGARVGFFAKLSRSVVWHGDISRVWWGPGYASRPDRFWTFAEWRATYKLTPPRPGQAFECDVEL